MPIRNVCLLLVLLVPCVWGHQQKEAYTTILVNERSGNIEVNHRFSLHDAEHALLILFSSKEDILVSKSVQQQFSLYVEYKFKLRNENGDPIELKLVGFEIDGPYIWVYQEQVIPRDIQSIAVKMEALQEVWPDQVNHINVEKQKNVFSARLKSGDGWQTLLLE